MINLKLCPFCGGKAELTYYNTKPFNVHYCVVCNKCNVRVENFDTSEAVVDTWNKRYEPRMPNGAYVPAGNERLKK